MEDAWKQIDREYHERLRQMARERRELASRDGFGCTSEVEDRLAHERRQGERK